MATPRLVASLLTAAAATAQTQPATEFGTIAWQRDYDRAIAAAKTTNQPVLLLFQEVPG